MSYISQQWLWLKSGWTPIQWKIIRKLLICIVVMLAIDAFACASLICKTIENERLVDEVARWQFDAQHAVDRASFEARWRTNK